MSSQKLDEKEVFNIARHIELPDARRAYLHQACGADVEMLERVEDLLRGYEAQASFLESPLLGNVSPTTGLPVMEQLGTEIGPYRLLQEIGQGGMGVVYMAEQQNPVRRKVALKIIKPGMDTRQVIARFEAEKQALSLMDHPNIAKVLDAGATQSGRPYFVMELVRGQPITEYCDQKHLTPRQRLELLLRVCHAIQHAHQKGVIHRDIKPSNVLVAEFDQHPVPIVIDFGVAKAIGQALTEQTMFTGVGQIVGTLEYMSPEQAQVNQVDIDTRSDIYSLGVLMYELLTGSTPFDKERLRAAAWDEMLRIIREEEPPKPSTRLSDSEEMLPSISALRHTEPAKLTRLVRGELDWIVMKALEKDRNRRYETANEFASDLDRYLQDEPVQACPPSAAYRLRKFARRHWRAVVTGSAFVLLLLASVIAMAFLLHTVNQRSQERDVALKAELRIRQKTREALDTMSSQVIEEWLAKQPVLLDEHKQFLNQALKYYEEFAADTNRDESSRQGAANAYERVGIIKMRLGYKIEAEGALKKAKDIYAELATEFPAGVAHRFGVAQTQMLLGRALTETGKLPEAAVSLENSLSGYRALIEEFPNSAVYRAEFAGCLGQLGHVQKNLGDIAPAEQTYQQALARLEALSNEFPNEPSYQFRLALAHATLAKLLRHISGRSSDAESSWHQAVAILERLSKESPSDKDYRASLSTIRGDLGELLRDMGQYAKAEELLRQSLAAGQQLAAEFPTVPEYRGEVAATLNDLGVLLKVTDDKQGAEDFFFKAMEVMKQLADDFPNLPLYQGAAAGAMTNLSGNRLDRGDLDGARTLLDQAAPYHLAVLKAFPNHPEYRRNYQMYWWTMADLMVELKDHHQVARAVTEFQIYTTDPPADAYTSAQLLARCVGFTEADEALPEIQRQQLSTEYGDRAMNALRQAVDLKAKETEQIATDEKLDSLRSRVDFQELRKTLPTTTEGDQ